jgi:hypothetical protein
MGSNGIKLWNLGGGSAWARRANGWHATAPGTTRKCVARDSPWHDAQMGGTRQPLARRANAWHATAPGMTRKWVARDSPCTTRKWVARDSPCTTRKCVAPTARAAHVRASERPAP